MGFLKAPKFAQLSKLWGCLADYLLGGGKMSHPTYKPISPHGAQLVVYPMIVCQARRRGISESEIAACMGISVEALRDKLCGRTPLFFHELCAVQVEFFPDVDLEALTWRAGGGALVRRRR